MLLLLIPTLTPPAPEILRTFPSVPLEESVVLPSAVSEIVL
jgi:hypothetical protein